MLRNPCAGGANWLKVDVREPGARVRAGSAWRVLATSSGYASANVGPLHFGLGNASVVNVEVFWPGGKSKRVVAVKANQTLRIEP